MILVQYLGSLIMDDEKIDEEIDKRIANASRELLVLLDKLYLRMIICQLPPKGKIIRPVY